MIFIGVINSGLPYQAASVLAAMRNELTPTEIDAIDNNIRAILDTHERGRPL